MTKYKSKSNPYRDTRAKVAAAAAEVPPPTATELAKTLKVSRSRIAKLAAELGVTLTPFTRKRIPNAQQ